MAVWQALQRTVFDRADSGTASSFLQERFGHIMRIVCDIWEALRDMGRLFDSPDLP